MEKKQFLEEELVQLEKYRENKPTNEKWIMVLINAVTKMIYQLEQIKLELEELKKRDEQ